MPLLGREIPSSPSGALWLQNSAEQHHLLASFHLNRNITTKQVTSYFNVQTRALFIAKGAVTGNHAKTAAHKFRLPQTDGEARSPKQKGYFLCFSLLATVSALQCAVTGS